MRDMLFKLVCVLSLASLSTALRLPTTNRRAAVFGGAAAATCSILPANALDSSELKELKARAKANQLTVDRVIQRAKDDSLVEDVTGFDCIELKRLIDVDAKALKKLTIKLIKMEDNVGKLVSEKAEEDLQKMITKEKKVQETLVARIAKQVDRLEDLIETQGKDGDAACMLEYN